MPEIPSQISSNPSLIALYQGNISLEQMLSIPDFNPSQVPPFREALQSYTRCLSPRYYPSLVFSTLMGVNPEDSLFSHLINGSGHSYYAEADPSLSLRRVFNISRKLSPEEESLWPDSGLQGRAPIVFYTPEGKLYLSFGRDHKERAKRFLQPPTKSLSFWADVKAILFGRHRQLYGHLQWSDQPRLDRFKLKGGNASLRPLMKNVRATLHLTPAYLVTPPEISESDSSLLDEHLKSIGSIS